MIVTYAFRNAMLPVVTTLGMVFSFLLGANVLVEKVFAWPGIGSYAVEALIASDFAPVQGFVLTMAVMYVALNLIIDMLYGVIDPRVRLEGMTRRRRTVRRPAEPALVARRCAMRRYVIGENPVTGFAFGLFVLIVLRGPVRPLYRPVRSAGQQHRRGAASRRRRSTGSAPTSSAATCSAASSSRPGSTSSSRSPRSRWCS